MIKKIKGIFHKERRGTNKKLPFIFFILEMILIVEIINIFYQIEEGTIYALFPVAVVYVFSYPLQRLIKVIDRIDAVERQRKRGIDKY